MNLIIFVIYGSPIMRKTFTHLAVVAALALGATASHASLVFDGKYMESGTGLDQRAILTLQSPANTTNEAGSVAWNGSTDVATGDVTASMNHNKTLSIAETGSMAAGDLRIVFNIAEPGNFDANTLNLQDLQLNIFSSTGTTLWSSGEFADAMLMGTDLGVGKSGYVFKLDATQAADAQNYFSGTNRVGLSASITGATGAPESFYLTTAPIPEPETYALMLVGLGLLGATARRRMQQK